MLLSVQANLLMLALIGGRKDIVSLLNGFLDLLHSCVDKELQVSRAELAVSGSAPRHDHDRKHLIQAVQNSGWRAV